MVAWEHSWSVTRSVCCCLALTVVAYIFGRFELAPSMVRILVFSSLLLFVLGLSVGKPQAALYLILLYVPFLGLIRRILIPIAGWGSFDPLVILEPVVVLLLGSYWFYRYFFLRELIENDTLIFRLLRWMILIDVLEVMNPKQGGISVGYGGMIYYVVPLLWMILSRQHFDKQWFKRIAVSVFIIGIITGFYGLKQTYLGFYPFETEWISLVKITSLNVYGVIRAISTMTNSQEYAQYLAISMAVGWLFVLRGRNIVQRMIGLVGTGVMGWALFMESARGSIITAALAIGVMTIMNSRHLRVKIVYLVVVSGVLTGLFIGLSHLKSANGLITHNVVGLTDPLNSQDSSLSGHSGRMWDGIIKGIKMPIGYGLGSTTTAAGKFSSGDSNVGTEVDISNMFVSDGVVGGVLYITLFAVIIFETVRQTHKGSSIGLVTLGVIFASAGQWGNGELYSAAAVIWVFIGLVDKASFPVEKKDTLIRNTPLAGVGRRPRALVAGD